MLGRVSCDEHALGDLEHEQRRRRCPVRRRTARRPRTRPGSLELASGQVDAHRRASDRASGLAIQSPAWRQACPSTQRPSGDDQAGLLGQRDELAPAGRPPCGCCQRTSASTPMIAPRRQLDDRLVVEDELVALERARARSALSSRRASAASCMRRFEDVDAALAARSWPRTSPTSALRSRSSAGSPAVRARPRSRRWRATSTSRPASLNGAPQRDRAARSATSSGVREFGQCPRGGPRTRRRPAAPAVSPARSEPAQALGRPRRAAGRPAVCPRLSLIGLEVVEVEEQHGDAASVARRPRASACSTRSPNRRAVGQPGQRVVERLVAQLVLERLALGDVAVVRPRCRRPPGRRAGS